MSSALISTKSPIVCWPAMMARADIAMQIAMPVPKIAACPRFSPASVIQVFTAARS